jgi:hypothetical protein
MLLDWLENTVPSDTDEWEITPRISKTGLPALHRKRVWLLLLLLPGFSQRRAIALHFKMPG